MARSGADLNLLFGVLALQMEFIDRASLIDAMHRWVLHKSLPLGEILCDQGCLSGERRALLDALVQEHLKQHDFDPQKSLASISSIGSVREDLQHINDANVQQSLNHLLDPRSREFQAAATLSVGNSSSHGMRFRILRPHAKGGLGEVSIAEDTELHRDVALKEMQPDFANRSDVRARFVMEAEITGSLEHPGVVPVYGLGQYDDGRPFYAMRFIRGDSLREALEQFHSRSDELSGDRTLHLRKLLGRFLDVCDAIDYAHSRGVLHRDLKPGNIMLGRYGETLVVDWGLAKLVGQDDAENELPEAPLRPSSSFETSPLQQGQAIGTPAYMSPEQAAGRYDQLSAASDVYSLGATLYHVLTGQPPFLDKDVGTVLQRVQKGEFLAPKAIAPWVAPALNAICLKAMALEPRSRYASVRELAEDIEHWMADSPVSAYAEPLTERAARWLRRHRSWALAAAVALLVVSVVSVVAAVFVDHAQKQKAKAWELTAKTRFFDIQLLEHPQVDAQRLVKLERLLAEIEELSPPDADVRKSQLYDALASTLRESLKSLRFSDGDRDQFDGQIAFLQSRVQQSGPRLVQLISELKTERDARLERWDLLFDLQAPFESDVATVFPTDEVVVEDNESLRRIQRIDSRHMPTSIDCPPGDLELHVVFDRLWTRASLIGLSLNYIDDRRYDFLIAVPDFDYRDTTPADLSKLNTLEEVIGKRTENALDVYILRDGQPLRKEKATIAAGRLRLTARRKGGRLEFTINDSQTYAFEDPFPMPPDERGVFALYWPPEVHVERLRAQRLRAPEQPSLIQLGDELFAEELYGEALDRFRGLDTVEARYKAALCQFELGLADEFLAQIQSIGSQPPSGQGEPEDRWRLLAACRLLQHYIESRDWPNVRQQLKDLADLYNRDQIALLIPAVQHESILQYFRRPGANRSAFFGERKNAVEDLTWAVMVEELFGADPVTRRMTVWRLADAHRWCGQTDEALRIIRSLLQEPDISEFERIAMIGDIADILSLDGHPEEAIQEIDAWLLDDRGAFRPAYFPLLVIRAATHFASGAIDQARDDLDYFLEHVDVQRVKHAHYAHACGLRGLLCQDGGDADAAVRWWTKGLRRNWHEGYLEPEQVVRLRGFEAAFAYNSIIFDGILGTWTGEMTVEEAYRAMWNLYPGSGVFSTSFRKLLEVSFEPEFVHAVLMEGSRSPRGRQRGRMSLLHHSTTSNALSYVIEFVRISCLAEVEQTPQLDEVVEDSCRSILDFYFDGVYDEGDLKDMLNVWRGRFTKSAFLRLVRKTGQHDPELSASAAFAFGSKYAREGDREIAQYLFEYALSVDEIHPVIDELVRTQLARMSSADQALAP